MKKLGLQEIQNIEYEILGAVADICEKYNLRYGLCGGTLLGAVRHGGFIPWDDDIDIEMPRPDYMKFMKLAAEKLPSNYKLSSPYNDSETYHCYSKIYNTQTKLIESPDGKKIESHIYIDIFPIEGMPDGVIQQERHRLRTRRRMLFLYGMKVAKYKVNEKHSRLIKMFWRFISKVEKMFPPNVLIRYVDALALKYDFDKSKFNSELVAGYGSRETMPHIVYDFSGRIKFVNRMFNTFKIPEYYLTNIYGEYMKLPPENERISHDMEAFKLVGSPEDRGKEK